MYDQVEPSVECTRRSRIADFAAGTTAAIDTDRLLRNLLRTATTSSPVASYISTRPPSSSALTRAMLVLKLSVCDEKYGSETSTTVLRVSSWVSTALRISTAGLERGHQQIELGVADDAGEQRPPLVVRRVEDDVEDGGTRVGSLPGLRQVEAVARMQGLADLVVDLGALLRARGESTARTSSRSEN